MTTATPAFSPILKDHGESGKGDAMHVTLTFDTAMAATAAGKVYITDGALQEVIDRDTGAPLLQVVGATDTHIVDASALVIDGATVGLDVAGLLPGHTYSVVMGDGVLRSNDTNGADGTIGSAAFAGIRSSSQLQFTTAPAGDAPALASIDTSGSVLNAGGTIAVTLRFAHAVASLPQAALHAPNATVTGLATDDGGITWHATLKAPPNAVTAPANTFSLDLGQVADAAGHHGSGTRNLFAYKVDTKAPTATLRLDGNSLTAGHGIVATLTFSEAVTGVAAALSAGHVGVSGVHSTDGGVTWLATLSGQPGATAQGDVLALDLARVHDLAGNAGSGVRTSGTYAVDTQAPEARAIALDGTLLAGGKGVAVTFTFSEAIRDLPAAAIATPHATVSGLHSSDGGLTWTGQLSAAGPGSWSGNTIVIDLAQLHDLAGNAGSGSFAGATPYDVASHPLDASVAVGGDRLGSGDSLALTIVFSAPVDALDAAAIGAPHADVVGLAGSADGLTWTATLVPRDSGVFDDSNAVSVDLARLHDRFGNAGGSVASSGNYVVDTLVRASVDGIGLADDDRGAPGVTNDNHAFYAGTLTGQLRAGQSVEVTIDGQVAGTAAIGGDPATWSFRQEAPLGDGAHTVSARVVDTQGHATGAAVLTYTVDTTAPELGGTNVGAEFDPGSAIVLTFSEAVYPSGALLLSTPGGVTRAIVPGDDAFSNGHRTVTLAAAALGLAPGSDYTLLFNGALRDLAGNAVRAPGIDIHTLRGADTTPPTAYDVVPVTAGGSYGVGAVIEFTVVFDEAVAVVGSAPVIALNNGGYAELDHVTGDGTGLVFRYTVAAGDRATERLDVAGAGDLVGHVVDAAGNLLDQAHVHYTHLDNGAGAIAVRAAAPPATTAPAIAYASDSGIKGDGITSDHTPDLTGSGAPANGLLYMLVNGQNLGGIQTDAGGNWTWHDMPDLAPGDYNVYVGGIKGFYSQTVVLSIIDPPALGAFLAPDSNSGSPTDLVTNAARPAFTGSAEARTVIQVYADGVQLGGAVAGAGGAWRFAAPSDLADGMHTITLAARDNLGRVTAPADSHPLVFTIDTHAPDAPGRPVLDAASDSGVSDRDGITRVTTPTLTGSGAESFAEVDVYDGATLLGRTGAGSDGAWTFTVPDAAALAEGGHALTVRQVDAAGNRSAASAPLAITIDTTAPAVAGSGTFVKASQHWVALAFNEPIVFARGGALDLLDAANRQQAHYTWDVHTNWDIVTGATIVPNTLELNLGTAAGGIHLADSGALQDLAGNAALVGAYTLPGAGV